MDNGINLLLQCASGNQTDARLHSISALKEDQCGDGHDVVLLCDVGVVIHVQLSDLELVAVDALHGLHRGSHHLAGTAPVRVEVHKDRDLALQNFGFKIFRCNGNHNHTPLCAVLHPDFRPLAFLNPPKTGNHSPESGTELFVHQETQHFSEIKS